MLISMLTDLPVLLQHFKVSDNVCQATSVNEISGFINGATGLIQDSNTKLFLIYHIIFSNYYQYGQY